jgi:hypothetical protein
LLAEADFGDLLARGLGDDLRSKSPRMKLQ